MNILIALELIRSARSAIGGLLRRKQKEPKPETLTSNRAPGVGCSREYRGQDPMTTQGVWHVTCYACGTEPTEFLITGPRPPQCCPWCRCGVLVVEDRRG